MTTQMFTEKINAGIDFLNDAIPDWEYLVDVYTLDMSTYDSCILGQLYGNFNRAVEILFDNDYGKAGEYGFCMANGHYNDLTDEWISVINQLTDESSI